MARIYDDNKEGLYKLLDSAAKSTGATLVIPDLQRPYVWTPNQVALLVDSLIRGWPVGTLLLWRVRHDEKHSIPSRAFWQVVDRTGEGAGTPLIEEPPPTQYQMVLDGQQRLQSLLLATHGHNWGFALPDKDWALETGAKSAKGRSNKTHWSLGALCLDLKRFYESYLDAEDQLSAVEFDKAFVWAVADQHNGRSKTPTSKNYKEPLPRRYLPEHASRLVRFSRLWEVAGTNPTLKEKNYHEPIRRLLTEHGVTSDEQERYLGPLAELMTTLRDVKLHKVAYLELSAYDENVSSREAYDDAIVNIFTRLNTAGRTLTREEITFAWLKVGWDSRATGGLTAQECFKELQDDLKAKGLPLEIDELVSAVSFAWAVEFNQGRLLTNRDLLQGDIIRPMAGALSTAWKTLSVAIGLVMSVVNERKLERGRHYTSVNALAVTWAAAFQYMYCASRLALTAPQKDDVEKWMERHLNAFMDRWLICSTWAQRWARASGAILANYATQLAGVSGTYRTKSTPDELAETFAQALTKLVTDVEADALAYVESRLDVDAREQVSQYFPALWLWHRLDADRWNASSKPLRIGKTKASSLDVDHAVSVKIWGSHEVPQELLQDGETKDQLVNSIGNTILLDKSFNVSKSHRPLNEFMAKVHEIQTKQWNLADWASALGLDPELMDGGNVETGKLVAAVRKREATIRTDLARFVRGECARLDVEDNKAQS
jgi:hypothetical protein